MKHISSKDFTKIKGCSSKIPNDNKKQIINKLNYIVLKRIKWMKVMYGLLLFLVVFGMQSNKEKFLIEKETPKTIDLSVLPGLQYSIPRFHVFPGQQVVVNFENTDDMDHNLLIISPGSREMVVDLAMKLGADGQRTKYIPDTDAVLFHTSVLSEGQKESLRFKAPLKEGVYTYVCTLPGHGHVMYGAIYVNHTGDMPPLKEDEYIPQTFRSSTHTHEERKDHPYMLKAPYYYRLYIDGASPAAIVVRLPGDISYCWDATPCQLRFMWKDGFVDNSELWKGHKDAKAKIEGTVFYRETKSNILSLGNNLGKMEMKFKGYRITDLGYLEFHYLINGLDVYELIKEIKGSKGVLRQFTIPNLQGTIVFNHSKEVGVNAFHNGKVISGESLILDNESGKQFEIEFRLD